MHFKLKLVFYLALHCVIFSAGKKFKREELMIILLDHGIPFHQVTTWHCIAKHESNLYTTARNRHNGNHGLFQISENEWCDRGVRGCGLPCDELRNDDLSNDIECLKVIYNHHKHQDGDGFLGWELYKNGECNFKREKNPMRSMWRAMLGLNDDDVSDTLGFERAINTPKTPLGTTQEITDQNDDDDNDDDDYVTLGLDRARNTPKTPLEQTTQKITDQTDDDDYVSVTLGLERAINTPKTPLEQISQEITDQNDDDDDDYV